MCPTGLRRRPNATSLESPRDFSFESLCPKNWVPTHPPDFIWMDGKACAPTERLEGYFLTTSGTGLPTRARDHQQIQSPGEGGSLTAA